MPNQTKRTVEETIKNIHCAKCGGYSSCPGITHEEYKQTLKRVMLDRLPKKMIPFPDLKGYREVNNQIKGFNQAINEAAKSIEERFR